METLFEPGTTYKKRYRINGVGRDGGTKTIGIPPEYLEKVAAAIGLSVDDFCRTHLAVVQYNSFPGIYVEFELIDQPNDNGGDHAASDG